MVKFNVQRASGSLDIGTGSTPNFDKSGGAFREIGNVGDTITKVAASVQRERENNFLIEAQSNADIEWNDYYSNAVDNAPSDGKGFTNTFEKDYVSWKNDQLTTARQVSQEAHDRLNASLTAQQTDYTIKASNHEAALLKQNTVNGLNKMQEANVGLVYDNPNQLGYYLKRGNDAIEIASISDAEKVARKDVMKAQLQQASAQRLVDTDPREALKQSGGRLPAQAPKQYKGMISRAAAGVNGVSSNYITTLFGIETSFGKDTVSETSSARGVGQFVKDTWLETLDKHGGGQFDNLSTSKKLALRDNDELSFYMTAKFAADNKSSLQKSLGRDISDGELYIAHFMGAGGASKFIKSYQLNPNSIAADQFPKAAKANRSVYYHINGTPKTMGQVYNERVAKFQGKSVGQVFGVFADMPLEDRLRFQGVARASVNNLSSAESTQQTQAQNQNYHDMQIGILSNTVTAVDVNQQYKQGDLSDTQHVRLLSAANKAQSDLMGKQQMAEVLSSALRGEPSSFDVNNKDHRGGIDALFMEKSVETGKSIVDSMSESDVGAASMVTNTAEATGYIPKPASDKLLQMHASGTNDQRDFAYQTYNKLSRDNERLTELNSTLNKIKPFANLYTSLTENGFSQEDALKRMDVINSDDFQKLSDERGKEAGKISNEFIAANVLESFLPTFYFTADSDATFGGGKNAETLAMSDYRKEFEFQYTLDPDVERAKDRTVKSMERVWGESNSTGVRTLMKNPPENFVQPVSGYDGGSTQYVQDQLKVDVDEFAATNGHEVINSFIASDRVTQEDISNPYIVENVSIGVQGQPSRREITGVKNPSYTVGYTYEDADGNLNVVAIPDRWRPSAEAAGIEAKKEELSILLGAQQESEQVLTGAKISKLKEEKSNIKTSKGRRALSAADKQKIADIESDIEMLTIEHVVTNSEVQEPAVEGNILPNMQSKVLSMEEAAAINVKRSQEAVEPVKDTRSKSQKRRDARHGKGRK